MCGAHPGRRSWVSAALIAGSATPHGSVKTAPRLDRRYLRILLHQRLFHPECGTAQNHAQKRRPLVSRALDLALRRFAHCLCQRRGYALDVVGLSSTASFGSRLRWQNLVDGSVTVTHVLSSPPNSTRLTLCERDLTEAAVDGVWWPKSLDLSLELPDLVTVFNLWVGRVRRVVYDPTAWLPAPPRVIRRNEMVSLDPYRLVFSDTIYLKGTRSRDAVLFVLSPSSSGENAQRLLGEVAKSAQPMNAVLLRQLVRRCTADSGLTLESAPDTVSGQTAPPGR
jgi:hypothetical protein